MTMEETCLGREERRENTRYSCIGEASVRECGTDTFLRGRFSDISLGGCSLDMINPLPSNTEVEVTVSSGGRVVHAKGLVCNARPGLGMGIAFRKMTEADQVNLHGIINWLANSLALESSQYARSLATSANVASNQYASSPR
jgi:hypothetical protein